MFVGMDVSINGSKQIKFRILLLQGTSVVNLNIYSSHTYFFTKEKKTYHLV